jgi:hypothetical protein
MSVTGTDAGPARATAGDDTATVTPCPPPSSARESDAAEAAASVSERVENRSVLPQGGALTAAQAKRLSHWSTSRHKAVKHSWQGVCSPRQAIRLQCLDCCGEDEKGVAECADRCCPLWHFRPFQRKTSTLGKST